MAPERPASAVGAGALVLVATPIGNLGDLSARAVDELARADAICCEDTRRTGRLLAHAGVTAPKLIVVNEHTEASSVVAVVARIVGGQRVALVSDAGMPGISDPGEQLVRAAIEADLQVDVVPGPSAAITALVASGLPSGRFAFEGFLPRKGSGRRERITAVAAETRTTVLYEAPHRVVRAIDELVGACGGSRPVVLARELTKLHQEFFRGTLAGAASHLSEYPPLGEFVIVLGAADPPEPAGDAEIEAAVDAALAAGRTTRDAADEVASSLSVPRRRAYEVAVARSKGRR